MSHSACRWEIDRVFGAESCCAYHGPSCAITVHIGNQGAYSYFHPLLVINYGAFTMRDQNQRNNAGTLKRRMQGCLNWLGWVVVLIIGLIVLGYIYEPLTEA